VIIVDSSVIKIECSMAAFNSSIMAIDNSMIIVYVYFSDNSATVDGSLIIKQGSVRTVNNSVMGTVDGSWSIQCWTVGL
jgi:hypothetical protein